MDHFSHPPHPPAPAPKAHKSSILDTLPPKTAFIGGFVTAILLLGTIGFLILASMVLRGVNLTAAGAGNNLAAAPNLAPSVIPDAAPVGNVPEVTNDDHIRGNKNAQITLVEYSDFECPFCGRFAPTVDQALEEYGDKLRVVYRHFPLSFHPQAEPAAIASECAAEQGKFWEFHDILFVNQTVLSDAFYKQTATQLGLKASQFNDCLATRKYASKVTAQATAGAGAGVTGTPGSFVITPDGQAIPIKGALPYESVKQIIDAALTM